VVGHNLNWSKSVTATLEIMTSLQQSIKNTFCFKRPDLLTQSQILKVIDLPKLKNLMHVNIVVGGDHGGGKVRMTLKVNFHLQDKSAVAFLTQITSVSFSKDDTEILKETVLEPIGRRLWLIAEGGDL
jgi:hypothetical protein